MGEIIWQEGLSGLAVSTYVGPAQPAGVSRTRVQVTTADGQFLQLNPTEWADLCSVSSPRQVPSPHPVALLLDNARDLRRRGIVSGACCAACRASVTAGPIFLITLTGSSDACQ